MKLDEFIETEMLSFLNEKIKQVKEAEPVREEESPLLYSGKDFHKDIEIAIAANDLNKAKSIFDACKTEYSKSSGEQKQELFKTLNGLYAKIKDYLKNKKRQSLEGEISTLEEEGVLKEKRENREENVFGSLFTQKPSLKVSKEILLRQGERAENAPAQMLSPNSSRWVQESSDEERMPKEYPQRTATAERLMEDKIKEKINESCGVIRLAIEKKDLSRAIIEYNKLKEVYSLIPSILTAEKASIYSKILMIYKQIKSLEQEKLMNRISGPTQPRLTEEELVDKIAVRIDRAQAFILNKDLQKAIEEYQEANDLFELVPDALPEIKKKFLVDLARVYQGLQNLNVHLHASDSNALFNHEPEKVLGKYAPENPVEKIKRSMSKIERYLQAKALKSAMFEFNKIKSMCDHLTSIEEEEKKSLFDEIKKVYKKIDEVRKEVKADINPEIMVFNEPEEKHLEQVKTIHEEIRKLYSNLKDHNEKEVQENLLEIQHLIALIPDEKEQEKLLKVVDQLYHKTQFTHQEKRLMRPDHD
ncbi:MAG TPA: hypothetical protein VJG90_03430 [Candidatus Nanoarchaeia archaeon]|nr:hypothetical protein [Candidatus Nanoarchaeia archaeon]